MAQHPNKTQLARSRPAYGPSPRHAAALRRMQNAYHAFQPSYPKEQARMDGKNIPKKTHPALAWLNLERKHAKLSVSRGLPYRATFSLWKRLRGEATTEIRSDTCVCLQRICSSHPAIQLLTRLAPPAPACGAAASGSRRRSGLPPLARRRAYRTACRARTPRA